MKRSPEPVVCRTTPPSRGSVRPALLDAREHRADAEELRVARHHLADLAIEQHEQPQEFEQPIGLQQRGQQPVLRGSVAMAATRGA
ncbi:MAG: hypothetical protein ACRYGA_14400 [Janthinobacterium lividum]